MEIKDISGETVFDTCAESARSYYTRLAEAKDDMANPRKTNSAVIGTRTYEYEDLGQVVGIVRPALREHGLDFHQYVYSDYLCTDIIDCEGGVSHNIDRRPLHLSGDARADGSKETYARRYALKSLFCLVGEDDDGEAASSDTATEQDHLQPLRDAIKVKHATTGMSMKDLTTLVEGKAGKRIKDFTGKDVFDAVRFLKDTEIEEG